MTLFRLTMILIGLGGFKLYGPAMLLLLLFEAVRGNLSKVRFEPLLISICWFVIFIFVFTIGYSRLTLTSPPISALKLFIMYFVLGLAFANRSEHEKRSILLALVLGLAVNSLVVLGYSLIITSNSYGYGNLYDPLAKKLVNSPLIGSQLAIVCGVTLYMLMNTGKLILKGLYVGAILVMLVAAIVIASRSFFVLSGVALLWVLFNKVTLKRTSQMAALAGMGFLGFQLWLSTSPQLQQGYDFFIFRFSSGLQSQRFELFAYGFSHFFNEPWGGYSVPEATFGVQWYHNMFLDLGRLAGIVPAAFFLNFTLLVIWTYLVRRRRYGRSLLALIFALCWLISMQEVILEGKQSIMFLMYLSGIALADRGSSYHMRSSRAYPEVDR